MSEVPKDVAGVMTARIMARIKEAVEAERSPNSGYMIMENTPHIRGRYNAIFQAIYQQLHQDLIEAAQEGAKAVEQVENAKEAVIIPSTYTADEAYAPPIPVRPTVSKQAYFAIKGEPKKRRRPTKCTNRTPKKRRK